MEAHLHKLITAHYCRSTHHFIVMDAIERMSGPDSRAWYRLLLHERKMLLRGAKAPDSEFKDFKNHVLHVGGKTEWGGARGAATEWYGRAVRALSARQWNSAAYALGVLSHYYADPVQPFHTGQTEAEGAMHRALEWSIFKSRPELKRRMDAAQWPRLEMGRDTNFVSDMVGEGARLSHAHYNTFIDHYDLDAGSASPESGLDEALLETTARLLAHAVSGVALLFERAIAEAGVKPRAVTLSLGVVAAEIGKPLRHLLSRIEDAATRRAVEAAYAEYQRTGKVIENLSDDDGEIRRRHALEVRGISLDELDAEAPAAIGTRHGQGSGKDAAAEEDAQTAPGQPVSPPPAGVHASLENVEEVEIDTPPLAIRSKTEDTPEVPTEPVFDIEDSVELADAPLDTPQQTNAFSEPGRARSGLGETSPVVDAPSIGKRTARHLRRVEVLTIADLLAADPEALAARITQRHISAQTVRDWQDQTRLKMALPGLRVHDVQILVGAGIRSVDDLRAASASELFEAATRYAATPAAERIIHSSDKPTRDEVDGWISKANAAMG